MDNTVYTITYKGKGVSLNAFYSQGHWHKRNAIKNEYGAIFRSLLQEAKVPKLDKFNMVIRYNSRHDLDNIVGMSKILVDTMKKKKDDKGNVLS